MKAVAQRPIGALVLSRPHVVLSLALLAGCVGDSQRGRVTSPPRQTLFTYHAVSTAGSGMNCVLVNVAAAMCWGSGTLGDGRTTQSDFPVRVTGGIPLQTLASAGGYACGVSSGAVFCWGVNNRGNLGDGTRENRLTPVLVRTAVSFRTISATGIHTCGVSVEDLGYCWGWNVDGQLGIGSSDPADSVRLVPAAVAGGLRFRTIETGSRDTCGLTTDSQTYCWGEHWGLAPVPVPTTLSFESITMDGSTTCGLTAEGDAHCWGSNTDGQFGNGEWEDFRLEIYHDTPVQVITDKRFSDLSVSWDHACGIDIETSAAYCWGSDVVGQLGDGTPPGGTDEERKLFPTRALLTRRFTDIDVGGSSSCGVTTGLEAYCWGWATGNASSPVSDIPVRVGG